MSDAAAEYARHEHDLDRVADLYVVALEEGAGGTAVQDAVLHDVATAAGEVGFDMNDPDCATSPTGLERSGLATETPVETSEFPASRFETVVEHSFRAIPLAVAGDRRPRLGRTTWSSPTGS